MKFSGADNHAEYRRTGSFLGQHTWQYSGLTPGSTFREHSWMGSRNYSRCQGLSPGWACSRQVPTFGLFLYPSTGSVSKGNTDSVMKQEELLSTTAQLSHCDSWQDTEDLLYPWQIWKPKYQESPCPWGSLFSFVPPSNKHSPLPLQ